MVNVSINTVCEMLDWSSEDQGSTETVFRTDLWVYDAKRRRNNGRILVLKDNQDSMIVMLK